MTTTSVAWMYLMKQSQCIHCRITTWNEQLTGYSIIPTRLARKKWTRHLQQNRNMPMAQEVC